jgi:hypothetical protein
MLPSALCQRIDVLRDRPVEVVELAGGLTNRNVKATTPEGSYVVRRSVRVPGGLAINRDHEHRNSVIAAASGVGPPVHAYLPDEDTLVIGFLEGRTLGDHDFARPGVIERAAAACRQLHAGGRFVNDFDMFDIQQGYLATVLDRGYRLPDGYLEFEPDVARIRGALAVRAEPTVACNNDLLAANFIDQGERMLRAGQHRQRVPPDRRAAGPAGHLLLRAPAGQPVGPCPPPGADVPVRLDAMGVHPAGDQRHRLRLLDVGDGEVRTGRAVVPPPRSRRADRRRAAVRLSSRPGTRP